MANCYLLGMKSARRPLECDLPVADSLVVRYFEGELAPSFESTINADYKHTMAGGLKLGEGLFDEQVEVGRLAEKIGLVGGDGIHHVDEFTVPVGAEGMVDVLGQAGEAGLLHSAAEPAFDHELFGRGQLDAEILRLLELLPEFDEDSDSNAFEDDHSSSASSRPRKRQRT